MKRIKNVLEKYKSEEDIKNFSNSIEMLCKKGIANGVYQDYSVLADVVSLLTICEAIIKAGYPIEE